MKAKELIEDLQLRIKCNDDKDIEVVYDIDHSSYKPGKPFKAVSVMEDRSSPDHVVRIWLEGKQEDEPA